MDLDLAKVLNLLGIVLEFLSFWLVAPEILGEERLRALERRLEKGMKLLPVTLAAAVSYVVIALAIGVVTLVTAPVASLPVPRLVAVVVLPAATVLAAVIPGVVKKVLSPLLLMAAAAVMAVMAGVVLVAVPAPPTAMLLIVWVLLVAVMTVLEVVADVVVDKTQKKVVAPVLRVLANDERIRRRSLAVGAVLFVIAFLCQFTAALLDISGP